MSEFLNEYEYILFIDEKWCNLIYIDERSRFLYEIFGLTGNANFFRVV